MACPNFTFAKKALLSFTFVMFNNDYNEYKIEFEGG